MVLPYLTRMARRPDGRDAPLPPGDADLKRGMGTRRPVTLDPQMLVQGSTRGRECQKITACRVGP